MSHTYNHKIIERTWSRAWDTEGVHNVDMKRAERPYYNLMMFPYPSAEGLHVGNMFAFVGSDIHGRYKRMCGFDVFEPMGFDAFGMHTENFALKTGRHPWDMTPNNIRNFREHQLKRIGNRFDWNHEVNTTDPGYYRWTQWLFLELYRAGLAYRKKAPVNWCPSCKTVLANEQARDDTCERCGSGVETRNMNQWFFRITAYADRLLEDLERIDWSEATKQAQRYWIGRSPGASIVFPIIGCDERIEVFTTRPDTVFGVTFLAVSPDHELASELSGRTPSAVSALFEAAERDGRTPFGIPTGRAAVHPLSGAHIPIWIADYVVSDYGHSAVMGVPAHDERDYRFAEKYDIRIVRVIEAGDEVPSDLPHAGHGICVNSGEFTGMDSKQAAEKIIARIESLTCGRRDYGYRLRDWCVSRQRYWGTPIPIVYCDRCGTVPVPDDDLPVVLPYMERFEPDGSGRSPLAGNTDFRYTSCPVCGETAERETDVCDNFLDSAWYFLRYPTPDDDARPFDPEITEKWLPVDMYIGGNEHAVLHLMYTRFITKALYDRGHVPFDEPFARFRANGMIVKNGAKMSKSKGNVINPDEYIERYGADVFRTYLMFFGNYTEGGDFRDEHIPGVERFLDRVYRFGIEHDFTDAQADDTSASEVHRRIRKVTDDIEHLRYNTAIAGCMELYQIISEGVDDNEPCPRDTYVTLIKLLSPFAPFLTQEIWSHLGLPGYISESSWPAYDESQIDDSHIEFVVQINGKLRDRFVTRADIGEDEAIRIAENRPRVTESIDGKEVVKTIFVPGKLLNLVVR